MGQPIGAVERGWHHSDKEDQGKRDDRATPATDGRSPWKRHEGDREAWCAHHIQRHMAAEQIPKPTTTRGSREWTGEPDPSLVTWHWTADWASKRDIPRRPHWGRHRHDPGNATMKAAAPVERKLQPDGRRRWGAARQGRHRSTDAGRRRCGQANDRPLRHGSLMSTPAGAPVTPRSL